MTQQVCGGISGVKLIKSGSTGLEWQYQSFGRYTSADSGYCGMILCVCVCVFVSVCVCVCVYIHAYVRACMRVWGDEGVDMGF